MVSKSQIKLITSLGQKKNRTKTRLFIVEGIKGIEEVLNSPIELYALFTTRELFNASKAKTYYITEAELKQISFLSTPQVALGIFKIPNHNMPEFLGITVALDGVRDPGNLGTIIRLCDWFGIENLVCSQDTVDCYNPKVIQATMGSITRVKIHYMDLPEVFATLKNITIYGTFMEGENIYNSNLSQNGIIIMGNEANGISSPVEKLVKKKISIPQFGKTKEAESLNVATATAITLSEFSRQSLLKSKI